MMKLPLIIAAATFVTFMVVYGVWTMRATVNDDSCHPVREFHDSAIQTVARAVIRGMDKYTFAVLVDSCKSLNASSIDSFVADWEQLTNAMHEARMLYDQAQRDLIQYESARLDYIKKRDQLRTYLSPQISVVRKDQ
jgi:hypothetical protein